MAKTDDDSEKTLANLSLAIEKLRIEVKSGAEEKRAELERLRDEGFQLAFAKTRLGRKLRVMEWAIRREAIAAWKEQKTAPGRAQWSAAAAKRKNLIKRMLAKYPDFPTAPIKAASALWEEEIKDPTDPKGKKAKDGFPEKKRIQQIAKELAQEAAPTATKTYRPPNKKF